MNIRSIKILFFILSLTFFATQNATATKVYQWADEEGVVHFSDVPPADITIIETREINFDSFENNNTDPEIYSIIALADRMAERRKQITKERLAIKRLQLEEKRLAQELEISRLNAMQRTQVYYRPQPNYYAYPQPFYNHQQRHAHNQPKYRHFLKQSPREIPMIGRLRINTPNLRVSFGF